MLKSTTFRVKGSSGPLTLITQKSGFKRVERSPGWQFTLPNVKLRRQKSRYENAKYRRSYSGWIAGKMVENRLMRYIRMQEKVIRS
jgi:hypothetical protein